MQMSNEKSKIETAVENADAAIVKPQFSQKQISAFMAQRRKTEREQQAPYRRAFKGVVNFNDRQRLIESVERAWNHDSKMISEAIASSSDPDVLYTPAQLSRMTGLKIGRVQQLFRQHAQLSAIYKQQADKAAAQQHAQEQQQKSKLSQKENNNVSPGHIAP